jgi:hypothetical protein
MKAETMLPARRQLIIPRGLRSLGDGKAALIARSLGARQISGAVLLAFSIAIFVVNLPAQIASLHALFQAAVAPTRPPTLNVARFLHALGVSETSYVTINVTLLVAAALASFLVSGLILWRRADDPIALLGVAMLLSMGVSGPAALTGAFDSLVPSWPWHALSQCSIFLAAFSFPLFFLLFPSGQFIPRWTQWLLIVIVPLAFMYAFFPQVLFSSALSLARSLFVVGLSLCLIVAPVYRYRHVSSPVQRQQTKWVSLGVVGGLAVNALGTISLALLSTLHISTAAHALFFRPTIALFILLGPVYVGMAITRSRLWSIDVIIRRTLIYGTLTATLALIYFGVVIGAQSMTQRVTGASNQDPVVIVATTLLVAALFAPLRRRIQALIDRTFYRSKYDAARTLNEFGARLRTEIDPEELRAQLLKVVEQTMQPTHLTLWLGQRERLHDVQRHHLDSLD